MHSSSSVYTSIGVLRNCRGLNRPILREACSLNLLAYFEADRWEHCLHSIWCTGLSIRQPCSKYTSQLKQYNNGSPLNYVRYHIKRRYNKENQINE